MRAFAGHRYSQGTFSLAYAPPPLFHNKAVRAQSSLSGWICFIADRGAQSVFTCGSYNASDRSHPTPSGPSDSLWRGDTRDTLLLTRSPDPVRLSYLIPWNAACSKKDSPFPSPRLEYTTPASYIIGPLLPLDSHYLPGAALTLYQNPTTQSRANPLRPRTPVVSCLVYTYTYTTRPTPYTTYLPRCISNRRLAHRPPSPYPSVSRLAGWLLPPDLSAATTRSSPTRAVLPRAPIHHGPPAHHSVTAARLRPSSPTPTSLVMTLTTTTHVASSPKRLRLLVNPPWLRHFQSCHHCMHRRSPRASVGAAAARSSAGLPSP
jgi:hypothetical protein